MEKTKAPRHLLSVRARNKSRNPDKRHCEPTVYYALAVLIGIIAQKRNNFDIVNRFPAISVAVFIYGLQMYAR